MIARIAAGGFLLILLIAFVGFTSLVDAWTTDNPMLPDPGAVLARLQYEQLMQPQLAVEFEASIWLDGYETCPVLAEQDGYKLGLLCDADSRPTGRLMFEGPVRGGGFFVAGDPVVPLRRWVAVVVRHDGYQNSEIWIDGNRARAVIPDLRRERSGGWWPPEGMWTTVREVCFVVTPDRDCHAIGGPPNGVVTDVRARHSMGSGVPHVREFADAGAER